MHASFDFHQYAGVPDYPPCVPNLPHQDTEFNVFIHLYFDFASNVCIYYVVVIKAMRASYPLVAIATVPNTLCLIDLREAVWSRSARRNQSMHCAVLSILADLANRE